MFLLITDVNAACRNQVTLKYCFLSLNCHFQMFQTLHLLVSLYFSDLRVKTNNFHILVFGLACQTSTFVTDWKSIHNIRGLPPWNAEADHLLLKFKSRRNCRKHNVINNEWQSMAGGQNSAIDHHSLPSFPNCLWR